MTAVVSDTSPINYLCLIEAIEVLPRLFDEVLIPPAVFAELRHPRAPRAVSDWLDSLPPWAKVQAPLVLLPGMELDPGETEAISLALELELPAILIDERAGSLAAQQRGIAPIGTLNILLSADTHGFLNFEQAVERLRSTNFHINESLLNAVLEEVRARKKL